MKETSKEIVCIKVKREVSQRIKVLAVLEGQTMQDYLENIIRLAHEAKNYKTKAKV